MQGSKQVSYGLVEQVTLRGGLFAYFRASAGQFGPGGIQRRFRALPGLQGPPAALCGQQLCQRRREFVTDYLIVDHVDPMEEGLVELSASLIRGSSVKLVRVGQQVEVGFDVCQSAGEVVIDSGELSDDLVSLPRDLA
ncbi:hypothetical protein [Microbacterium capsulatum]|uniref:Uncharacterized protein n=1 Tax=Microbacterium capsulatum TaxID=3041921 RepID=A0ABU0XI09_9MICO|nr:hypothetical protein [Microbacterium sp. ASV81]MDQ4214768.1 hypothetical protein [Microbacterium sp. ASV81]